MSFDATYIYKLDAIGPAFSGLWVKLRESNHIPYNDFQRLWAEDIDTEGMEEFALSRIAYHIAEWNLPDANGGILPVPQDTENPIESMKMLPASLVSVVGFRILNEFRVGNEDLGEEVRSFSDGAKSFSDSTSSQESPETATQE